MNEERVRRWLALAALEGLGPAGVSRFVEVSGGLDAAWERMRRHRPDLGEAWRQAGTALEAVERCGGRSVSWEQPEYPPELAEIRTAPQVLHMKGERCARDELRVAVVGTRRCTSDAAGMAFRIGRECAAHGIVVVSGLARGIDVAAMKGALLGGGRVVAVLAHGFDRIHPPGHARIAHAILDGGGAWWTEFAPGIPPEPWRFAWRNRIVVGASKGLVMVQSPGRGGAMISVRWAMEENREVGVLQPTCSSATWDGNRRLLHERPELGYTSLEELFGRLGLGPKQEVSLPRPELPQRLQAAWEVVLVHDGAHVADVAHALHIPVSEASTRLLLLELLRYVRRVPGEWYVACVTGIDR